MYKPFCFQFAKIGFTHIRHPLLCVLFWYLVTRPKALCYHLTMPLLRLTHPSRPGVGEISVRGDWVSVLNVKSQFLKSDTAESQRLSRSVLVRKVSMYSTKTVVNSDTAHTLITVEQINIAYQVNGTALQNHNHWTNLLAVLCKIIHIVMGRLIATKNLWFFVNPSHVIRLFTQLFIFIFNRNLHIVPGARAPSLQHLKWSS